MTSETTQFSCPFREIAEFLAGKADQFGNQLPCGNAKIRSKPKTGVRQNDRNKTPARVFRLKFAWHRITALACRGCGL